MNDKSRQIKIKGLNQVSDLYQSHFPEPGDQKVVESTRKPTLLQYKTLKHEPSSRQSLPRLSTINYLSLCSTDYYVLEAIPLLTPKSASSRTSAKTIQHYFCEIVKNYWQGGNQSDWLACWVICQEHLCWGGNGHDILTVYGV